MASVDDYTHEQECVYKDERYSVRDNGAVLRHPRDGKHPRPTDNQWTFGKPNDRHGYMEIASARVHIIVATAFYGEKPTKIYVVDHIDANRRNNRLENLRWLTRLENTLQNPITRKNIEIVCGCTVEEFLANPEEYRDRFQGSSFEWMRSVSAEEAKECLKNRIAWAESDTQPSGGSLGEWVFQRQVERSRIVETMPDISELMTPRKRRVIQRNSVPPKYMEIPNEPPVMPSLTHGAAQRNWRTPTEFPNTPHEIEGDPIASYSANLKEGAVFCRNQYDASLIVKSGFSEDRQSLFVMTESDKGKEAVKSYALAKITYEDGLFVHTGRTFFTKEGAEKELTLAQGLDWTGGDTFDDFC